MGYFDACPVSGTRHPDHITPVLQQLHWLPVRQRVIFKIAGLVHQSLAGAVPHTSPMTVASCRMLAVAHSG